MTSNVSFQYTKHFELINYSPCGTYVNNMLYSNEVRTKIPEVMVSTEEKCANLEKQVREIIDKKRKIYRTGHKPSNSNVESKMSAVDTVER